MAFFGLSLNSSKWVSMGAALQCDHWKKLWPLPVGQGHPGRRKARRCGVPGTHAREVVLAAAFIQPHSSASKAGGVERSCSCTGHSTQG